jgi:hypothetical protein
MLGISAASEEDPESMPGILATSGEEDPVSMPGICNGATTEEEGGGPGAGFTNFTKFLIRILLSFYHVAQAPRRTLVRLYQHIPTNSVGESGPRQPCSRTNKRGKEIPFQGGMPTGAMGEWVGGQQATN